MDKEALDNTIEQTTAATNPPESLSLSFGKDIRCEHCGYGYRHTEDNGNQRRWCKRCIDIFYRREALVPEKAERQILDLVGFLYGDAKLDDLDEAVREKLLNLKQGQSVFFYGLPGTGKTYAMSAMLRQKIYEGYSCEFVNFDDFCVRLRASYAPASPETEYGIIEPLKTVDLLFVDDLGLRSKQESDFVYVTFYTILEQRRRNCLPTFICSNKDVKRLGETFDARITSRLQHAEKTLIIEMTGKDRRNSR
ncbi:MAG: ATP-binding protein [Phycisphaerae bacterium]|jgi:DNA replication protein DnaC